MFQNLTDRAKAVIFYALALSLGLATLLLAPVFGALITILYMFTPLLAVLLMLLVVTRDGYTKAGWAALGLRHAGFRAWGLALLLPCLTLGFGYSVVWLTGVASLATPAGGLVSLPIEMAFAFVIALPLAFGEELGWRGYLQPRLDAAGVRLSVVVVWFVQFAYHLPLIVGADYLGGDNLLATAVLFAAGDLSFTFLAACLAYRAQSLWPAVFFHSFHNTISQWLFPKFFVGGDADLLLGETGLLPALGYVVVGVAVLLALRRDGPPWAALARSARPIM